MYAISFLIGVGIFFPSISSAFFLSSLSPEHKCFAQIHKEIKTLNLTRSLGGIVGIGWNDITNEETLPVLSISYDKCETVPDGDFLVPDNVVAYPVKMVNLEKSTERYDTFGEFKSSIGGSIEAHAGGGFAGFGVSGSMSAETKIGKEHMEQRSRTGFSKKLEYQAFQLVANENEGFDKSFTNRLKEVAEAIKGKNLLLAQYEAESIIGDYGTHVTNKALAGAKIMMLGFATCTNETQKQTFAANMSASFEASYGIGSAGGSVRGGTDQSSSDGSSTATSQTYVITRGGVDVNKLLNDDSNKMSVDSVVGLTRSGIAIHSLIHKGVLDGHYDDETIEIVQDLIYNATQEFYRHNTIPGCTDPTKQNYFYKANVEDGTCKSERKTAAAPIIGGVIQECEYISSSTKIHKNLKNGNQCDQFNHPNQLTKNYDCPSDFEKKVAGNFYPTFKHRTHAVKNEECNSTECTKNYAITDKLNVTTYWCYQNINVSEGKIYNALLAKEKENAEKYTDIIRVAYEKFAPSKIENDMEKAKKENRLLFTGEGMIFGGIFENDNVFSDNRRCEVGFQEYPYFHNLKICLAPPTDFTAAKSVEFGGMISCQDPNQACPQGFSRYLATTINGCPYYYCAAVAKGSSFRVFPILKKPPYIDRDLAMSKIRYSYQHEIEEMEEKENESAEEVDVN